MPNVFNIPWQLSGRHILLKPVSIQDIENFTEAARGVDWSWMPFSLLSEDAVADWVRKRIEEMDTGVSVAFAVFLNSNGKTVGSSSYLDIRPKDRGLEIGSTWYSPSVQGTYVNPECKFVLLKYAFEEWDAIRVQLKTDHLNVHSQKAIEKLGAVYEGELRNHVVRRDGSIRHTRMYSITSEEWPIVRKRLEERFK